MTVGPCAEVSCARAKEGNSNKEAIARELLRNRGGGRRDIVWLLYRVVGWVRWSRVSNAKSDSSPKAVWVTAWDEKTPPFSRKARQGGAPLRVHGHAVRCEKNLDGSTTCRTT